MAASPRLTAFIQDLCRDAVSDHRASNDRVPCLVVSLQGNAMGCRGCKGNFDCKDTDAELLKIHIRFLLYYRV
jgi:hypothetical protein